MKVKKKFMHIPDTSELDLRYSLANLVAVVLGKPQHSSHLWYHLFAPQNLENSYITGFMVGPHVSASLSIVHPNISSMILLSTEIVTVEWNQQLMGSLLFEALTPSIPFTSYYGLILAASAWDY